MYFFFKIKCADESCTMRPGMHMKKMHVPGLIHFVFMLTLNGGEKKNLKRKGKKWNEMKKCHALAAVKGSYVLSCVIQ